MEADAAGENSHDLRVGSHLGREENHRYEHEQGTEHVHEVRDEIHVIVEDDLFQRSFIAYEVIDFLAYVENDYYSDYEQQRYEEGHYELLHYVHIENSRFEV